MAERRPLVLIGGVVQQLPAGDTLPSSGGGAAANIGPDYTAKSAGTITLTSASPEYQLFTGPTTGQVIQFPAPGDCDEGKRFYLWNREGASINYLINSGGFTLIAAQAVKAVRGFDTDGTTPLWIIEPLIQEVFTYLEIDQLVVYSTDDNNAPFYIAGMATPNEAAFTDGSMWVTDATLKVKLDGTVHDLLAGGGGGSVAEIEVDFGSTPVRAAAFTVIDAAVTPTSKIVVSQSGNAPTGKDADENEWDVLHARASAETGQFKLWVDCLTGTVAGTFKFNYLVGG